jgi:hypothetical protein
MKQIFQAALVIAAIAASFTSCSQKEMDLLPESKTVTTHFTAHSAETRTVFGAKEDSGYPVLWTTNKDVKVVFCYTDLNTAGERVSNSSAKDATVTVSNEGKEASFSVQYTITETMEGEYNYFAVSPSNAYVAYSESRGLNLDISDVQTPLSNSVDEGAQVLVAKEGPDDEVQTNIEFEFAHATAYAKMTLKDLSIPATATVSNYTVSAEDIAGRWYYNNGAMEKNSAKNTITINPTNVENGVVWIALAPVDLRGKTFKVTVNTSAGPIEKEITFPASGNAGKFQSGHVSPFTVNMAGLTPGEKEEYTLVTDVADLTLYSEVIIAAANYDFAISTTQNTNNRAATAVTKTSDGKKIENPSDAVQIFKIGNGDTGGTYAFYYNDGDAVNYIYAASSDKNYLRTTTTLNGDASWNISIESGVTSIVAAGDNTNNILRYNNSNNSNLFSCYGSASQKPVAIYKKAGTGSGAITPASKLASIAITTLPTTTTFTAGGTFVFDGKVTATYENGTTKDVTGKVTTNGQSVIAEAGENKVVTVTYEEGGISKTATYTVTVNEASGKTVTFTPGIDTGGTTVTKDGITVSMTTMDNDSYYQVYANQSMTVSSDTYTITGISFTCTAKGTSKYGPGNASANTGNYSYSEYTGNWSGSASSVTISSTAQIRMTSLTITYE